MKILTRTRLQGVTWSTFQPPLEGQANRASTGIFLRCAALCQGSSWACRGARISSFNYRDRRISNHHEWEFFMQRFYVLD